MDLTRTQLIYLWERQQRRDMRRRASFCTDVLAAVAAVMSEKGGEAYQDHVKHLDGLSRVEASQDDGAKPSDTYTPIEALLG